MIIQSIMEKSSSCGDEKDVNRESVKANGASATSGIVEWWRQAEAE